MHRFKRFPTPSAAPRANFAPFSSAFVTNFTAAEFLLECCIHPSTTEAGASIKRQLRNERHRTEPNCKGLCLIVLMPIYVDNSSDPKVGRRARVDAAVGRVEFSKMSQSTEEKSNSSLDKTVSRR
ncbi:hypothetical protein EVAR_17740_1 [Eumeta japonica]|uniref:Uncharacterized protein n=1 Tax=Eumeta variegata TaxID=151549 RepID=A0A4C1TT98_EUMVA|nr:hypothetical protein EVAR_17740_1 [Eumeta japonica]